MPPLLLVLLLAGDSAAAPGDDPAPGDGAALEQPAALEQQPPAPEPPAPAPSEPAPQGQEPKPAEPEKHPPVGPPPPHTGIKATLKAIPGDFAHLPTGTNIGILGFGGVLALGVHPYDETVNSHLSGSKPVFWVGKYLGNGAILVGVSIATYGFGRATDNRVVSHLGMDLLRAAAVSGTITYAIKLTVRRDRPTGECCSFPSGHSSGTFAFASVLWRHLGWKAAVPTYTIASYVALSRLHEDVHWLSDVVFGAAVGIVSGRAVTRHDRHFWGVYPMPVPGGGIGVAVAGSFR